MKILVVEDEAPAIAFLQRGLREEGYAVDVARSGHEADGLIHAYDYDLVLLDVMVPGIDGFELCRQWRTSGNATPIIFLTARDDTADRINGLNLGGDDYLTKPYDFEELLARIRAILRRSLTQTGNSLLRFGDLEIDLRSHRVYREGQEVVLTAREYQLLEYFALHSGELITRSRLWDHVWESGQEPDSNVIEVYVRYLRDKLGRNPDYLRTIRGSGYIFGA
ncbi:MAG: response regulator transcription factor [Armatimonadetes bacterium]|nr:response regulator [Armatimonadota bacterium]MBS1700210.1 response regulator transcription factor [Armatimonadota bacterium]MBS1726908.1 response regulator transcription factor [Armatimonadota bacterium]